jgi:membrane-bound lytic murein transglycosylase D
MQMKKYKIWMMALAMAVATPTWSQSNQTITVTGENGTKEQIGVPESMTQEIDSLLQLYNAKMYLHPDSDCHFPDVNPTYDKQTIIERLGQLPTVIELPYNEVVRSFIDRYTTDLRQSVSYMLGAQNFYMPIFEEALEAYGLPLELKYLPVIESGLNPKAVSRVGATGLWQFMLKTAKRYGLEVNSMVDDRCDIVKASYAAAHYLSDLYKVYKDWPLVIAAYNCGPDAISKAIHRSKGETDYWKIYPKLPSETRGYVPAFIAANYVMNYYCDHNICPMTADLPMRTDTVMLDRNVHFEQIAHVTGIDMNLLRALNPQYRRDIINGNTTLSSLRLPQAMMTTFIDNEDSVYAYNPRNLTTKRTEVDLSDKATYIVRRNQVTVVDTPKAEADEDDTASTETRTKQKSTRKSSKSAKKSRKEKSKSVSVREGDTLSEIAERNGTTVAKLRKLNKISGSNIRAGKKIRVK